MSVSSRAWLFKVAWPNQGENHPSSWAGGYFVTYSQKERERFDGSVHTYLQGYVVFTAPRSWKELKAMCPAAKWCLPGESVYQ